MGSYVLVLLSCGFLFCVQLETFRITTANDLNLKPHVLIESILNKNETDTLKYVNEVALIVDTLKVMFSFKLIL